MKTFSMTLEEQGLALDRKKAEVLQVNLGLVCNQECKHCHLSAGPNRKESMDLTTVSHVAAYAQRGEFSCVDITGGAPELNPNLPDLIEKIRPHASRVMLRANLTALVGCNHNGLADFLLHNKVDLLASFPALNPSQTDAQRGNGVFDRSVSALQMLNRAGFGVDEKGPSLDLVVNPVGAFLPPPQDQMENRFKKKLGGEYGISFNRLFVFANVPLGRFRAWLQRTGNLKQYLEKLTKSFNPCALDGLMCRTLVSVDWEGFLYDCDFNLSAGMPLGGVRTHVTQMEKSPEPGGYIAVSDHCFTCTAGAGFT